MNRNKGAPLIRRDLPKFERTLPTIWTDCSPADAGIVDEAVDPVKPDARGSGDLIRRGVVGQVRLDGDQGAAP